MVLQPRFEMKLVCLGLYSLLYTAPNFILMGLSSNCTCSACWLHRHCNISSKPMLSPSIFPCNHDVPEIIEDFVNLRTIAFMISCILKIAERNSVDFITVKNPGDRFNERYCRHFIIWLYMIFM